MNVDIFGAFKNQRKNSLTTLKSDCNLLLLLDTLANVTVGEAHELADPEENTPATLSCRQSTWQCVSKAIEGSLHYIDNPEGITR